MDKLNSDMALEILNRLPIRSILQCREVCRLWQSLLGKRNPGILLANIPDEWLYCGRARFYRDVQLYYRDQSSETIKLNFTQDQQNFYSTVTKMDNMVVSEFKLVGSCNGLVCYTTSVGMYIFNPITAECIRVPEVSGYCWSVGFGYCHSTDAYKVVRTFRKGVQVYTLGDGSGWRDKPETTYVPRKSGVYANGALHWLNKISSYDIVAFDLADETFRSLPSPPCQTPTGPLMRVNLASVGGNLYLCHSYYSLEDKFMLDIWVFEKKNMNNCGRSAHVKENTYFESFTWINVLSRKWHTLSECQLLSLTESEIQLMQDNVLYCCDPKATASEKLWCPQGSTVQAIPHMNTLVSLKDLGEELVDCEGVRREMLDWIALQKD